jgi:uncharacterized repeat protein (TIGR01451 family)
MKQALLLLTTLLGLAWAMAPAGTIIRNQAVVQIAGERYLSNVVETVVQALCVPTVTPNGSPTQPGQRAVVSAGGFAYFAYLLTNNGNDVFSYTLNTQFQGSPWALSAGDVRYYHDTNGNAQRDPNEPQVMGLSLRPEEEIRLVMEVRVPQSATGEMNLSPVLTCPDGRTDQENYARITVGSGPALSLEKAVEPKAVAPGQEVTFTLRLRNNGNQKANGPLYVSDWLNAPELAGLSFVEGSASTPKGTIEYSSDGVAWSGSATPVHHIRLVSPGLVEGEETYLVFKMRLSLGVVSSTRRNIAKAEGAGGPALAEQEFRVVPKMEHHLGPVGNSRALNGLEGSPDDLQRASVVVGQRYCFAHTLENAGSAADHYTLSHSPLPAGIVSNYETPVGTPLAMPIFLQAGQFFNFRHCVQVSPSLRASALPLGTLGPITLTSHSGAGNRNLTQDVITLLDPSLLKLTKSQSVSKRVEAEGSITYTLRVENTLPLSLADLVVEDVLDANLEFVSASNGGSSFTRTLPETPPRQVVVAQWLLGSLASGQSKEVSLRVRVKKATPEGTVIRNFFNARSTETPNPLASNTVSVPVESVNLLVQKTVSAQKVSIGDLLTYTVVVSNPFTNPMVVKLADTPPAGLEYVPGSASLGEPSIVQGRLEWSGISLAPEQQITVTYKMRVLPGASPNLQNIAQAFSNTPSGTVVASSVATSVVTANPGVFAPPNLLVGRVFLDANRDGKFTVGQDKPLPGARVVLANGLQALTDSEGRYNVRDVPGGLWEVFLDPVSAPFKPLPHPEALGEGYRHRLSIGGLTVTDFPLEMPAGYATEERRTVLEFGPLKVSKSLMVLPQGIRVVLHIITTQPLPELKLSDPLPDGGEKVFEFNVFEGQQTLTYDLPRGHLTDPQVRWRYP